MTMIVDYDAGNLRSLETALKYLGAEFKTSSSPKDLAQADRIIIPGVGHCAHAMKVLNSYGLVTALRDAVQSSIPLLGICIGSQLILGHSDEGQVACLDLVPGTVRSFASDFQKRGLSLKVPHIGWNQLVYDKNHTTNQLFREIPQGSSFYFVHSFYPQPDNEDLVFGRTDYGINFPSVYGKEGLIACQFHPEKSGLLGLKILDNFIRLF